jgi:Uma2 family endonuclease
MATAHSAIPLPVLAQFVSEHAPPLEPLTIKQVEQMMRHGILPEGAPIELIDGLLVRKDRSARGEDPMTHNPAHALCVKRLMELLSAIQTRGYHLQCQLPVALSPTCAPEPDVAIIRGAPRDYRGRHPGPGDIAAVFEVADSSLDYDRSRKLQLYAAAGIPIYWIVNLIDDVVEVYNLPDSAASNYSSHVDHKAGDIVNLALQPPVSFALPVNEIIG